MQQNIIERLNSIPLSELLDKYSVEWEEGRNFRCPFPAHGATGNTPSARFYPETNSIGCFGCHKGGGPIQFVENMEGCSFLEACDKLMDLYGIEKLPEFSYQKIADKNQKNKEEQEERTKFNLLAETLGRADHFDVNSLLKFSMLYAMLPTCSYEQFIKLTVDAVFADTKMFMQQVPNEIRDAQKNGIYIIKHLVRHSFEMDRAFDYNQTLSGFFNEQMSGGVKWQTQNNRYLFPIFLPGKFIVGFSGRALNGEFVKYQTELMFGLTKKDLMYGLDVAIPYIWEQKYVIIVEGILDVIRCRSLGFYNVVAPCPAYVTENIAIILRVLTQNFLLFQDADYGGDQEAAMSEKVLDKCNCVFVRRSVPAGEDPDSYGKTHPMEMAELLKNPWS